MLTEGNSEKQFPQKALFYAFHWSHYALLVQPYVHSVNAVLKDWCAGAESSVPSGLQFAEVSLSPLLIPNYQEARELRLSETRQVS